MENSKAFVERLIKEGKPVEPSFLCMESPDHLLWWAKSGALDEHYKDENLDKWIHAAAEDLRFLCTSWAIMYTYYFTSTSLDEDKDGPTRADQMFTEAQEHYKYEYLMWVGVHCFG